MGTLSAMLVLSGIVLARYADEALPAYFVLRPLAAAAVGSVLVGVFAAMLPVPPAIGGLLIAASIAARDSSGLVLLASVCAIAAAYVVHVFDRGTQFLQRVSTVTLALGVAFMGLGVARAVAATPWSLSTPAVAGHAEKENLYLVLLDGYPRADSLAALGIDNHRLADDLEDRGFDVYDQARSERTQTELTLLALLSGTTNGVPAHSRSAEDRRTVRSLINEAPAIDAVRRAGFDLVIIDSPIGHVTFDVGTHVQSGGLTDFEERLLAPSWLADVIVHLAPAWPMDSLRMHFESSLAATIDAAESRNGTVVLTHLLAPHLPFLWDDAGPTVVPQYWPRVQLFESVNDIIELPMDDYVDGYRANLRAVNAKLLAALDRILAADPHARIVLFGDHGARYSLANDEEWTETFMAARTPGHPWLLADDPAVHRALCELLSAYASAECLS